MLALPLKYRSGEDIRKGDRAFIPADQLNDCEDLEFVARLKIQANEHDSNID